MNSRGADVWATPVGLGRSRRPRRRPALAARAADEHGAGRGVAGRGRAAARRAFHRAVSDRHDGGWRRRQRRPPPWRGRRVDSPTSPGGAGGGGSTSGFSGGGGGGERAQRAARAAPATPAAASVAPAAPPQGLRVPPASIALPTVAPEVAAEVRTVSSAPRFRESPRAAAPVGKADPLSTTMTAARRRRWWWRRWLRRGRDRHRQPGTLGSAVTGGRGGDGGYAAVIGNDGTGGFGLLFTNAAAPRSRAAYRGAGGAGGVGDPGEAPVQAAPVSSARI